MFLIIGILVITLVLAFALKLFIVKRDGFGQIEIWYLTGKNQYSLLNKPPKHSLAKFSKFNKEMNLIETFKLLGKPTDEVGSWVRYRIDKYWFFKFFGGKPHIVDYANERVFKLEYEEYITTQSYLRDAGAFTSGSDNRQKHSLAKFSKIKIGMSPKEVVKLAGKPTDSLDSSFIWYRYKIDTGWYMDLHFFNKQLSDMSIVDYPNNRVFELEQDDYITALPCPNTFAQTDNSSGSGMFTDSRDGKTYRTVKIGELTWMAENLNFVTESSLCYDNVDSNCTKYGRLYNWDDAMKACPAGWRLSSDEDWAKLALAVANKCNGRIHWRMAAKKLKSTTGWYSRQYGYSGDGTDDIGFSALPGGNRYREDGFFLGGGSHGDLWSATEGDVTNAKYWWIISSDLSRGSSEKGRLCSVRCVREQAGVNITSP